MPATRGAFDKVVAPGALDAFADEYDQLAAEYPEVFNISTTQRAFEEVIVTTGLGTMPTKPEGEKVMLDRPLQVGSVKMVILSYGLGYGVSHELMEDDLYNVVSDPASRFLAQSQRDAEERVAWSVLNLAPTTQQAYDGVSLIHAAHPLKGGGTASNRPGTDAALSFTTLQASVERFRKLVNERSLKIKVTPDKVVVPVELQWLIDEILGSSQKPFEASNTTNVMAGGKVGLTSFSSVFLSSATAWFVLARKHKMDFFWREKPNMDRDYDKLARIAYFMNFSRFGTVAWDWRGVDGSTG